MPSRNYGVFFIFLFYVMLFVCEQISYTVVRHADYYTPQPPQSITEKMSSYITFILYNI